MGKKLDKYDKQMIIMGILVIGMIAAVIIMNYVLWQHDIDNSHYIRVAVTDKPTISSGSWGSSYTECEFEYNGVRYHTHLMPCSAHVGEDLSIRIDSHNMPDIYSTQYIKG